MNLLRFTSIICFILSLVIISYAISIGEVKIGVFFIVPFLVGSGFIAFIGFLLLFIAILLFFMGGFKEIGYTKEMGYNIPLEEPQIYDKPKKKGFFEGGGVILIGPIPIVFGSNWRITTVLIFLAIVLMAIAFFMLIYHF